MYTKYILLVAVMVLQFFNSISVLASNYLCPNFDSIKAQTGAQNDTADLQGYRNINDGGEGKYKYIEGISNNGDNVFIIKPVGATGAWVRQPTDTTYPVTTDITQPVYFSWLDPDTTANNDSRNKLQLALNAARTRAGSSIGKLYITPGNFKIESTMPINCSYVSIEGLSGHKLWNSLPAGYVWRESDYDGSGDHRYTATNVINSSGTATAFWTSDCGIGMPWNGKTEMFYNTSGINSSQRIEIKNLVIDFGWGTANAPGTVNNITGINDGAVEFVYYQGFSGSYYADFTGCIFSNAPGAYIEVGNDVTVRNCAFSEYGDHVFYFAGNHELVFENNIIEGTRSQIGSITNGIPDSDYVGLTRRDALKFRGCQGITIRDNVANIPNGYFCYFETSDIAAGDCGGYSDTQRSQVSGNKVNCNIFMGTCSFRTRNTPGIITGPYYVKFIDFVDNSIKVSSYFGLIGNYSIFGTLRDCTFARNGIEVNNASGWTNFLLFANPDQDYKDIATNGVRPIGNVEFISNNVLGGIKFFNNGPVGKIYVAHNKIAAPTSNASSANELFCMSLVSKLPNGETGYLPRAWDYIYCCDNELINYFAFVLQNGEACTKLWVVGDYGYDSTTFKNIADYPATSAITTRSLIYYPNGSGTKLYINKQDCTSQSPSDNAYWEAAVRQRTNMYCKNNIIRNDMTYGCNYDLYQWGPMQLEFHYEGSGNVVTSLSGASRTALHSLSGGIADNLTDGNIASAGVAQLLPSDIPDFPYMNIALNKPYILSSAPNYWGGCTDAGDATQLTDGIYTSGFFWTQLSTIGWFAAGTETITIDLGLVQPIKGVSYNSAGGTSGVYWPTAIDISVSSDGVNYSNIGELVRASNSEHGDAPPASPYTVHRYWSHKLLGYGRFVKIAVTGSPYIFVDEIEIYR